MLGLGNTLVKGVAVNGFGKPLSNNAYSVDFDGANDYIATGDEDIFSFGDASTDSPFSCFLFVSQPLLQLLVLLKEIRFQGHEKYILPL